METIENQLQPGGADAAVSYALRRVECRRERTQRLTQGETRNAWKRLLGFAGTAEGSSRFARVVRRIRRAGDASLPQAGNVQWEDPAIPYVREDGGDLAIVSGGVSVVIPTWNAGAEFERLLQALRAQRGFDRVEIVVVDSGSSDQTLALARTHGAKLVQLPHEEFSHSYARNLGVAQATGEYLMVMTQDAMPTSRFWLYNMYLALTYRREIAAVSCAEFPRRDADLYQRAASWSHYRDIGACERDALHAMPQGGSANVLRWNAQLSDVACFMRAETARRYPYTGDYAEDLALGLRLIRDGYSTCFLGRELVIHSHCRPAWYYLRRAYKDVTTIRTLIQDFPVEAQRFEEVVPDALLTCALLDDFLRHDALNCLSAPVALDDAAAAIEEYLDEMRYLHEAIALPQEKPDWLDADCWALLQALALEGWQPAVQAGRMLEDIRGWLKTLFDYMRCCYDFINGELYAQLRLALGKAFASALGTRLAFCRLTQVELDARTEALYRRIGAGV